MWLSQKDEKSSVRAEAITFLADKFPHDQNARSIIEGAMKDRSYRVLGATLKAIANYDTERAIGLAKDAEAEASGSLISSIASLYSKKGGAEQLDFFLNSVNKVSDPSDKYVFVQIFGKYLMNQDFSIQAKGLPALKDLAINEGAWWMRLSAIQVLNGMRQTAEPIDVEEAKTLVTQINAVLGEVREKETNAMIKGMIGE
jgi:aminopeptidase N